MGKPSAPAAPNYAPIAASDMQAAQLQYSLGQQQLQFGKDQYNAIAPSEKQFLDQQIQNSAAQTQNAQDAQNFYNSTYKPMEAKFADTAANYSSPANAAQQAGSAMADVGSAFDANRAASLASLESFGIDPSQTRYGALDLGTRISQAAATSAAGTQSYLNNQATGLALQGEAINTGRGYAGNVAQAYGTASTAGTAGIGAANQTLNTGVNAMGNPNSYFSGGNSANEGARSALNTGFTNQFSNYNAQMTSGNSMSSGIGSLLGTAAMGAMMFA